MRIGKAIKIALVKRDMSQTALAKDIGVSKAYLSAICGDHKSLSIKKAQFIADRLGMKLSELIALGEDE